MAIKINGKNTTITPPTTPPPATTPDTTQADLGNLGGTTPVQSAPPVQHQFPKPPQASFLMTGDSQKSEIDKVKAQQDLRSKLRGGAREFYLNAGEFAQLYFLDGKMVGTGVWDTPMIATHLVQIGGDYVRFVCMKHTEGTCIVCDSNEPMSQPITTQLFTVINTVPYVIRKGPNKGKTIPARLQLFAATIKVRDKLEYKAKQRGNVLAGHMFQFKRNTNQDARTGDDIEHIQEVPMQGVLAKYPALGTKRDAKGDWHNAPTMPLDYSQVYPVLTNTELAQLRPDMAYAAGFTSSVAPGQVSSGLGTDTTGDMPDQIPF